MLSRPESRRSAVPRGRSCEPTRVSIAPVTLKAQSRTEQLLARIAELESALAREERISAALREVGVALGTTLDLDQLLELILEKITDLLQADRATLYLLDEAREELVSRIAVGDAIRSVRMRVGEGIAGMVARTGQHDPRERRLPRQALHPRFGRAARLPHPVHPRRAHEEPLRADHRGRPRAQQEEPARLYRQRRGAAQCLCHRGGRLHRQ